MNVEDKKYDSEELIIRVLTGEASKGELLELETWKEESPENQQLFDKIEKTWKLIDSRPALSKLPIDVDYEWKQFLGTTLKETPVIPISIPSGSSGFSGFSNMWVRLAAVVLMGVAAAFAVYYFSQPSGLTYYAETPGLVVSLPDGSSVTLDVGTTLTVDEGYENNSRDVSLDGEAFFEVEPSSSPFTVALGESSVRVVGTSFNIRNISGEPKTEVVVVTGKVRFSSGMTGESLDLAPGDKGSMNQEGRIIKIQNHDVNYLSWMTRTIVFEDTRLEDAIEVLNRVYHTNIRFSIPPPNCIVTVIFENQTKDAVLSVLAQTMDLTIENEESGTVITGAACQ